MGYTFHFETVLLDWDRFLAGAGLTVVLSGLAMTFGLVIGVTCALIRSYGRPAFAWAVAAYVEFIRNTPFLIQLFFVFFALPSFGLRLSPNLAALVAMTINLGAYSTEIARAGIESVPHGQIEAGRALGLSRWQIVRFVVLLPALKAVYPALCSQFILTLLGSSVVSAIAAEDLSGVANDLNSRSFRSFEIYTIVAVLYVVMAFAFRGVFGLAYRHLFARWST